MLDLKKPLQTRDGRPVRLMLDIKGKDPCPLIGAYQLTDKTWRLACWTKSGEFMPNCTMKHIHDLVNVPEVMEGTLYVNVYEDGLTIGYPTREQADRFSRTSRFACVHVPIVAKRGQGLT